MKYGICVEGGGARGAHSVGALKAIVEKFGYSSISTSVGTSVGAISAALVALKKVDELEKFWLSIKSAKDIYQYWNFSTIKKMFKTKALLNNSPLLKLINSYIDEDELKNSDINFGVNATNYSTGLATYFTNRDGSPIRDAIIASSSIPVVFPSKEILGQIFVDGGISENIPIDLCLQLDPNCDQYFIILPNAEDGGELNDNSKPSFINNLYRTINIIFYNLNKKDIKSLKLNKKFKIIQPKVAIIKDTLDFDPKRIALAIEDGYRTALEII